MKRKYSKPAQGSDFDGGSFRDVPQKGNLGEDEPLRHHDEQGPLRGEARAHDGQEPGSSMLQGVRWKQQEVRPHACQEIYLLTDSLSFNANYD